MNTLEEYDQLPYTDCPIFETHPDHLSVIGRLFGLPTTPADRCRVLELGCANGGNLIPMAYHLPNSEFIGVELSKHQANRAQQTVSELGVENITILHRDITNLSLDLGTFDYIIAHGVYSWVPNEVRSALLRLCGRALTANGIAYISYNTLPGWHLRQAMRTMLLYHAAEGDARTRMNKGNELLTMLANGLPEQGSLSEQWMRKEAIRLLNAPANYVFHDYMESINRPTLFTEFVDQCDQHGLQYLAESSLYTMLDTTLTPQAAESLDRFEDIIQYEQYLDFFYLKHFRQSLLCRKELEINRDIDPERLRDFAFFSHLHTDEPIDLNSNTAQYFHNGLGEQFPVPHPLTKAALTELTGNYPSSIDFETLIQRTQDIVSQYGDPKYIDQIDELLRELLEAFIMQGVGISLTAREFPHSLTDQPRVSTLASNAAEQKRACVASARHHSVGLDGIDHYLLLKLDGQQTAEEIITEAIDDLRESPELQIALQNKGLDLEEDALKVAQHLHQLMQHYALHGLLEG